jgi:hypothetical protein
LWDDQALKTAKNRFIIESFHRRAKLTTDVGSERITPKWVSCKVFNRREDFLMSTNRQYGHWMTYLKLAAALASLTAAKIS